jgi:hypothetical protein
MMRALLAAVAAVLVSFGVAHADPAPPWADDHFPDFTRGHCAGGHQMFGALGWCNGTPYADGSYWHQEGHGALGGDITPRCLTADGSPAAPSGCGGHA